MTKQMLYTIGERKFKQLPLSLGQAEHLIELVRGLDLNTADAMSIIRALKDNLYPAMYVVLVPENRNRADHIKKLDDGKKEELEKEAAFFRSETDIATALNVVTDFLECNQAGSLGPLFEKLTKVMSLDVPRVGMTVPKVPSKKPGTSLSMPA